MVHITELNYKSISLYNNKGMKYYILGNVLFVLLSKYYTQINRFQNVGVKK